MKVQWQLVNIKTKTTLATFGSPFDLEKELLEPLEKELLEGTGNKNPVGILKGTD